jgi:hypothetical protein
MEIVDVTIAEAKKRWRTHTKKILSDYMRGQFKQGAKWSIVDHRAQIATADLRHAIRFYCDTRGNVYGRVIR